MKGPHDEPELPSRLSLRRRTFTGNACCCRHKDSNPAAVGDSGCRSVRVAVEAPSQARGSTGALPGPLHARNLQDRAGQVESGR